MKAYTKICKRIVFTQATANYSTKLKTRQTSTEYCWDSVRQHDYENYACTLLLRDSSRSVAFAIRSFNVEVARIGEQVSQPQIGFMRMKFWEETLEKCYSKDPLNVPEHPVAIELYKALMKAKLSKRYFMSLLTSRRDNLSSSMFYTIEDMEKYADKSVSSVLMLVLEGCGVNNVHADHAASHIGKAQGIVNQLRTLPLAKHFKSITLPKEILAKHKVSEEDIYRGKSSEQLSECTFEVASRAYQHLQKARNLMDQVPKEARCALLPAVNVDIYLTRLQEVNHDALNPLIQKRHWKLLPSLWWTNVKNKY